MKRNAVSGLPLMACISVYTIVILLSVADIGYAKRGCSAFGHSCFGGHGKRFDPSVRDIMFQGNELTTSGRVQETKASGSNNEFMAPEQEIRRQLRRQAILRLDANMLSPILRQWFQLMSHRRPYQLDIEVTNK